MQECETPPPPEPTCETAFAFGGNDATCFLDLDFSRWGWTNGPLGTGSYEFEIYAAAGQCDLSKGTLVGMLTVDYNGSIANVTFAMESGFVLDETHLYVGNEILPMDNGAYTIAPGQYPYKHDLTEATSDNFSVPASGEIYIVAHAVACGVYPE